MHNSAPYTFDPKAYSDLNSTSVPELTQRCSWANKSMISFPYFSSQVFTGLLGCIRKYSQVGGNVGSFKQDAPGSWRMLSL